LIEFEEFFPGLEQPKEIFEPIQVHEQDLMENIHKMNGLNNEAISSEFYKLFAKFEKPRVSFWDVIAFVWNHLGGGVKLLFCLFTSSIIIGGKHNILSNS
jgi:hypothetical protein